MRPQFNNEPLTDFSLPAQRESFALALEQRRRASADSFFPLRIGGRRIKTDQTFFSYNPSQPEMVLGEFAKAGAAEASKALDAAWKAFDNWSKLDVSTRAAVLFRAAGRMRRDKHLFSAQMVLEAGKSWVEADADTAEAIDFIEFYAQEALRLSQPQPLTTRVDEMSELHYIPLGVGAVIPPWNFPNAILVGMTSAALVMGNTVVLKPASDTPGVATMVYELFESCGLPAGALNLLCGPGALAGEALVADQRTRFISFTGSKAVGLRINELAAKQVKGQRWIKRVVAEMGGKDTIVVDETADLADAARMTVAAAYGFGGQKCSACSRVVVTEKAYARFRELLLKGVAAVSVGDPQQGPEIYMGPVINQASVNKVGRYIRIGRAEGKLIAGGKRLRRPGYFFEPTVFEQIKPGARLDQEEIFGPVLALIKVKDFDEAIKRANATEYGLTGAVFTMDPERAQLARREFFVGNLYINRKCTGALVGVHPFGGFNMSGTDSKAGGRDYLLLFSQAKSVSERLYW
ncbi:MAG: L-glutamate gamma-semialdehyde dehydrogenase [Candidatus Alcyoniella australis]|nr:L-glutamate gamma-semialdehyde dehydrogenase [Candidatus Alcyoniella australis]